jgi:hypothetical protein
MLSDPAAGPPVGAPRFGASLRALSWQVRDSARRHGAAAAAGTLLDELASRLFTFDCVRIIALDRARARRPADAGSGAGPGRLAWRLATEADLRALQAQGGWQVDDTKLALLRAGEQCLLSLIDDRIAGYTWVHARGRPEILPGLWLRLPPGWLYNFAGYTHPDFRGGGLQSWRHAAVLDHPAWQGSAGLVGWVKAANHDSRRGQHKSGYRPVGWVLRLRLGRQHWLTLASSSLARHGIALEPAPPGAGADAGAARADVR